MDERDWGIVQSLLGDSDDTAKLLDLYRKQQQQGDDTARSRDNGLVAFPNLSPSNGQEEGEGGISNVSKGLLFAIITIQLFLLYMLSFDPMKIPPQGDFMVI